jgi:hypothetical protein
MDRYNGKRTLQCHNVEICEDVPGIPGFDMMKWGADNDWYVFAFICCQQDYCNSDKSDLTFEERDRKVTLKGISRTYGTKPVHGTKSLSSVSTQGGAKSDSTSHTFSTWIYLLLSIWLF